MLWIGAFACKISRLTTEASKSIYRPVTRPSSCNMLSSVTISLTSNLREQGDFPMLTASHHDGCLAGTSQLRIACKL